MFYFNDMQEVKTNFESPPCPPQISSVPLSCTIFILCRSRTLEKRAIADIWGPFLSEINDNKEHLNDGL